MLFYIVMKCSKYGLKEYKTYKLDRPRYLERYGGNSFFFIFLFVLKNELKILLPASGGLVHNNCNWMRITSYVSSCR